jgi:hypothetical protein
VAAQFDGPAPAADLTIEAEAIKAEAVKRAARMPALTVLELNGGWTLASDGTLFEEKRGWAVASDDATRPLTERQAQEILESYLVLQQLLSGQS